MNPAIRTMSTIWREQGKRRAVHPSLYRVPKKPSLRDLAEYERQYFILLRQDMKELDNWVEERLPGAADLAARIMEKLKGIV